MSNLEIKALEFIIASKNEKQKAFLDTFIFEPENVDEQNLGSLYIIGEITDISANSEYLINLLVATIKKEYYSDTARSAIESFEAALSRANEMLADFAEQGNIEWIGNIHITIAIFRNNMLFFSQTGLSKALLVRGKNIINIGQDLVTDPKPHPLKTFSNIASGQVDSKDRLLLTTSRFLNSISENKILDILSLESDSIIAELQSAVSEKNSIAAIFLEAKPKNAQNFEYKKINIGSFEENNKPIAYDTHEKNTDPYASSSDKMAAVINEINEAEKESRISQNVKTAAKAARFITNALKRLFSLLAFHIKKNLCKAYYILKPKFIALKNKFTNNADDPAENTTDDITRSSALIPSLFIKAKKSSSLISDKIPERIKNIPLKNKLAYSTAILIIAAISYSAIISKSNSQEKENMERYTALLEAAKNASKDAEVSQIYNEDEKTRDLIRLAMSNIETISASGYLINETNELKSKVAEQIDQLELVVRLDNPEKLIDFAANSQNIKTDGIAWSNKKLYAFNSSNNAIYTYDFAKKTNEILATNSFNVGHIKKVQNAGNKLIFLTDTPGIAMYEPGKSEIVNVPIKFAEAENTAADLSTFLSASNLYLLSKSDNEIYKHRLAASGYAKGEKWLKDISQSGIQNPVSLTIDGNIFLLQNDADNAILKFTQGARKDFPLHAFLVPLKKATKIFTSEIMKNIYILDPGNKRIVIIDKEGKLIRQYTSGKFDDLIDFSISSGEKELYLLNKTAVYEITL